jgi:hypothetical protein
VRALREVIGPRDSSFRSAVAFKYSAKRRKKLGVPMFVCVIGMNPLREPFVIQTALDRVTSPKSTVLCNLSQLL